MHRTILPVVLLAVMCAGGFVHADDPWGRRVDRIEFRGNRAVADRTMRDAIGTAAGAVLDRRAIADDLRALWALGAFDDVSCALERGPGGLALVFVLAERPRLDAIRVSGNRTLSDDAIVEVLDVRAGAFVAASAVARGVHAVRALYDREGLPLAEVRPTLVPERDGVASLELAIDELSRVHVREVSFVGNHSVAADELRAVIRTGRRTRPVIGRKDLRRYQLDRDVARLIAHYQDRGFAQVQVHPPQLRLTVDRRHVYVTIEIEEGPRFRIGDVRFSGDLIAPRDRLARMLGVGEGAVYGRAALARGLDRVLALYRDRGYAYASIAPNARFDLRAGTVSLELAISQGEQVYVERIAIVGNQGTADRTIRRELAIAEGELYSQAALDRSRRRLLALGLFERVDITPRPGAGADAVAIRIEVSERRTYGWSAGLGATTSGAFGHLRLGVRNLRGRGQTLAVDVRLSEDQARGELKFFDPRVLDTQWSLSAGLFDAREQAPGFTRRGRGVTVSAGRRLSDAVSATLSYRLESVDLAETAGLDELTPSDAAVAPGSVEVANLFRDGVVSSLSGSISYDTRDDRFAPRAGWYARAFAEVADRALGSSSAFVRAGAVARHYRPLGPFVLRLNAEVGAIAARDGLGVPLGERYLAGGPYDIRGFAPRSLGPRLIASATDRPDAPLARVPLGGNLSLRWNSELELTLSRKLGLTGVVFFDAGNVYNLEHRYCASADASACPPDLAGALAGLRGSVGFGARWMSPLGPVRLEWAVPVERRPDEPGLQFSLSLGRLF